jgi:poly-gamma-glutamate capsule biosynthesis protein CapA/YwtB (metallophosphatase superfamily)
MGIYGGPGARIDSDYKAQVEDTSFIELVAVGDVMLARGVNKKIKEMGPNYPFEKTQEIISQADIAFCNLECAVSPDATGKSKGNVFCVKPEDAKGLSFAGFDVVSLANNHMYDCEKKGILSTMEFLTKEKIKFAGAGKTASTALHPAIIDLKSIRVGFLAFCAYPMDWINLDEDTPAIAFYDSSVATEAVKQLKKKADVVVVSMHWGDEYKKSPNSSQINIAHQLIDAGVDLILGHHPHVTQKIDMYKGALIAYSLGNFVFDQRKSETKKSMIFRTKISKKGVVLLPPLLVEIENFQPHIIEEILKKTEEIDMQKY